MQDAGEMCQRKHLHAVKKKQNGLQNASSDIHRMTHSVINKGTEA
jgi:hypothetical protein